MVVVWGVGGGVMRNNSVSKNCNKELLNGGSKNKKHFNGATSVLATRLRSQTPAAAPAADTRA